MVGVAAEEEVVVEHWQLLVQEGVGWLQLGLPVQGSPGVGLRVVKAERLYRRKRLKG